MPKTQTSSFHDRLVARLTRRLYDGPLIQNNARGDYIEEMIDLALSPHWDLCSGDWMSWDFENERGVRIQVKQSAARQSWEGKPFGGSFNIAAAKGYWINGDTWLSIPGRPADIYLFAWHHVSDDTCDHTDPTQWRFFVVPESELPETQKSIRRSIVETRWEAVAYPQLARAVSHAAAAIATENLKAAKIKAHCGAGKHAARSIKS